MSTRYVETCIHLVPMNTPCKSCDLVAEREEKEETNSRPHPGRPDTWGEKK